MHHTEFLIKIRTLNSGSYTGLFIAHIDIYRNKVRLQYIDHFKGNKKRDGDEVHQSDKPNASL